MLAALSVLPTLSPIPSMEVPELPEAPDVLTLFDRMGDKVSDALTALYDHLPDIVWVVVQILLIIVASKVILTIVSSITGNVIKRARQKPSTAQTKRTETIMTLTRSATRYVVFLIAIIACLTVVGLGDAMSMVLGTASIAALAIGFGAQSLVKDVVTGLFLMFENQYAVGDYVKIEDAEGIVEATALRVTYIRTFMGDQVIVPNGTITRVINYTRGGYLALVDVHIAYESDTRAVISVIDRAAQRYADEHPELIADRPKVLGVNAFDDSFLKVRVVCTAQPMKQWDIERGLRLAVKEAMDAAGIRFPYRHMNVSYGPEVQNDEDRESKSGVSDYGDAEDYRPVWQSEDINLEGGRGDGNGYGEYGNAGGDPPESGPW